MPALFCAALAPARAAADSTDVVHWIVETGVGGDYTNQIFYEQTFDSTAITGRRTVSDAAARGQGLLFVRAFGRQGRLEYDASNDFGLGPKIVRDALRGQVRYAVAPAWKAEATGEFDARDDRTFDPRRADQRAAGQLGMRWTSRDFGSTARVYGRVEGLRSGENSLALFPDYDFRQAGIDYDRLGDFGYVGASYAYGERSFPDTSARDYREHVVLLHGRVALSPFVRVEGVADGARRLAWSEAAIGDRSWTGDFDVSLVVGSSPRFEWGPRAWIRGLSYDAPDPTFFNVAAWRWAAFARFLPDFDRRYEIRPEVELLRTPDFGGLPPEASDADRRTVASEEYDQYALSAEGEWLRPEGWIFGSIAGGRRLYFESTRVATVLDARSDFWFAELTGFLEKRLGRRLRLRASADVRYEAHDISADDLTSLYLALELRIPLVK